jgi:hypothetical protein
MKSKFKSATDFRRSLETRLHSIASSTSEDLQRLRRKVAFDRFLARIFASGRKNFFLKGGYAMELRLSTARATKDIDLTCLERADDERSMDAIILEELRACAAIDLEDLFVYTIGESETDLDNAPYGGARYPVSSFIDGKLFVRFQLDVGADAIVTKIETIQGTDWLNFCEVSPPVFLMISGEQQFAEKIHAYTLPRTQRTNTRVKDLVDMALLIQRRNLNLDMLRYAIQAVFRVRKTHDVPHKLEKPPSEWVSKFAALAQECALPSDMSLAYSEVSRTYEQTLLRPEYGWPLNELRE